MNNFIVVYDEEIEDRGRDSYLKAIKKNIPEAIIADVDNLPDCTVRNVLALKPMADDTYKWIMELLEANPINDIEGAAKKVDYNSRSSFKGNWGRWKKNNCNY